MFFCPVSNNKAIMNNQPLIECTGSFFSKICRIISEADFSLKLAVCVEAKADCLIPLQAERR
jgi:hypothetical protein